MRRARRLGIVSTTAPLFSEFKTNDKPHLVAAREACARMRAAHSASEKAHYRKLMLAHIIALDSTRGKK